MSSTGHAKVHVYYSTCKQKVSLVYGGCFSPLSRANVTTTLRQLLHGTNEEPVNYASHSFRIGATTTAAAAGLSPALIKTLGASNQKFVWNPDDHIA